MKPNGKNDELFNALLGAAILSGLAKDAEKPTQGKKQPTVREQARQRGEELREAYLGFQDAGFDACDAFEMMLKLMD